MRVRNRPGKTQQARIFCGKALLLTQEQERKSTAERGREEERERERRRERGREQRKRAEEKTKRKRRRDEERECQNPVPFKENYPPPRTYYSLIGCSPSASCHHEKGRAHGGKTAPAHVQIICLPLRTQLSATSCNGECGRGSQHLPLSF